MFKRLFFAIIILFFYFFLTPSLTQPASAALSYSNEGGACCYTRTKTYSTYMNGTDCGSGAKC